MHLGKKERLAFKKILIYVLNISFKRNPETIFSDTCQVKRQGQHSRGALAQVPVAIPVQLPAHSVPGRAAEPGPVPVPQEPILQTQRKFWRLVADQPNYSLSELVAERFLSLSLSLDKSVIQENKQSLEREREREICFWLFFLGIRQKCVVYYI